MGGLNAFSLHFHVLRQDLKNANLNSRNASSKPAHNPAGSGTGRNSEAPQTHSNDSSNNNNGSVTPSFEANGNGVYPRDTLINKTVDDLPEGVDPSKKEVSGAVLLSCSTRAEKGDPFTLKSALGAQASGSFTGMSTG